MDVRRSGIDALATGGHKWLCAGYGAGFLYVRRELIEKRPPRAIGWMSVEDPLAFDNRRGRPVRREPADGDGLPGLRSHLRPPRRRRPTSSRSARHAIAERVLALNMYLTPSSSAKASRCSRRAASTAPVRRWCGSEAPPRARRFLQSRGVYVTEKPEGLRIATHFYNTEQDVDECVKALAAYRAVTFAFLTCASNGGVRELLAGAPPCYNSSSGSTSPYRRPTRS